MTMRNWQLRCAELKQRGEYLFKSKLWSDCAFQLGDVTIKAHKLIMAMASPFFTKMFYVEHVNSPVPIYDVRPDVFNILLEYIYSDNLNIESSKDACDLYYAAKRWRLPYIAKECAKYLSEHMTPDNVCHIYQVACEGDDAPLQRACEKIFSTKTMEVLNDGSFLQADLATVVKLFSLDPLNIYNELDLYTAAVKFANQQDKKAGNRALKRLEKDGVMECSTPKKEPSPAKRPRIDNTNGSQGDGKDRSTVSSDMFQDKDKENSPPWTVRSPGQISQNSHETASESTDSDVTRDDKQKEEYRDLLKQIRFFTLTPQEFADCEILSSLLTESEILSLSLNIASKESPAPTPDWFSTTYVPRTQATKEERSRLAAVFRSTIHNFKTIKKYESVPFYLRNCAWTLMTMPTEANLEDKDNIVVAVTCFHDGNIQEWMQHSKVKVKFCTHKTVPKHLQKVGLKLSEPYVDYGMWVTKFDREELFNPEYGFIDDFNAVTYKVYVNTVPKSSDSPVLPVLRNVELNASDASNLQMPRTPPSTPQFFVPSVNTTIAPSNALKPVSTPLGSSRPSTLLTTSIATPGSTLSVTCNRKIPVGTTAKIALPSVTTPIISSNALKPVSTHSSSLRPSPTVTTPRATPRSKVPVTCNTTPSSTIRNTHVTTTVKAELSSGTKLVASSNALKHVSPNSGSSRPSHTVTTPFTAPRPSAVSVTSNATPSPTITTTSQMHPPSVATKTPRYMSPAVTNSTHIRPPQVPSAKAKSHPSPSVTAALLPLIVSPTAIMSRPSTPVTRGRDIVVTPVVTHTAIMSQTPAISNVTTSLTSARSSTLINTLPTHISQASPGTMLRPLTSSRPSTILTDSSQVFPPSMITPSMLSISCASRGVNLNTSPSTNLIKTLPASIGKVSSNSSSMPVLSHSTVGSLRRSPTVKVTLSHPTVPICRPQVFTAKESSNTSPNPRPMLRPSPTTTSLQTCVSNVTNSIMCLSYPSTNVTSSLPTYLLSTNILDHSLQSRPSKASIISSGSSPLTTSLPSPDISIVVTSLSPIESSEASSPILSTDVTPDIPNPKSSDASLIVKTTLLTPVAAPLIGSSPTSPVVPSSLTSTSTKLIQTCQSLTCSSTAVDTSILSTHATLASIPNDDDSDCFEHTPKKSKYDDDESNKEKDKRKEEIKLAINDSENDMDFEKSKSFMKVLSLQELAFAMLGPLLLKEIDFLDDSFFDYSNENHKDDKKKYRTELFVKQPPSLKEIAFSMLKPMILKDDYDSLFN